MKINRRNYLLGLSCFIASCKNAAQNSPQNSTQSAASSPYEIFDPKALDLLDTDQRFEVLGSGYSWSEGPAWDKKRQKLYFTDVPANKAYAWSRQGGLEIFADPSGAAVTEGFREAGANGLLYIGEDQLLICNHGLRSVQSMNLITGQRKTLVTHFKGKKFNSPNDLIINQSGDIFFTDPAYGLDGLNASPLKEQPYNGVYVQRNSNAATSQKPDTDILIEDMTWPNGIALSGNEKTLFISQSDPEAQHIYSLDLTQPNAAKKLLVDLGTYSDGTNPGLPDGMVIDNQGHIFATGPGGIFIISPSGNVLARIKTGKASANCTFGEDGSTLFITNHDRLLRLPTKTRGLSF